MWVDGVFMFDPFHHLSANTRTVTVHHWAWYIGGLDQAPPWEVILLIFNQSCSQREPYSCSFTDGQSFTTVSCFVPVAVLTAPLVPPWTSSKSSDSVSTAASVWQANSSSCSLADSSHRFLWWGEYSSAMFIKLCSIWCCLSSYSRWICVLLNSRHQVMHLQLILQNKSIYHHWLCWRFVVLNMYGSVLDI